MARREKRSRSKGSVGNNRKSAEAFLEKNKIKEGVVETQSGLQYQVLEQGQGASPDIGAHVIIHQRCMVLNGNIIADTYKENKPEESKLAELIEGYKEGLMLMSKGSRYKFFIPSELAWGKKGSGTKIPPNALLIFDTKLIDFW